MFTNFSPLSSLHSLHMKTPSNPSHASPGTLTFSLLVLSTCKVDKNNFLANTLDSRQLGIALYFHVPGYSQLQLDFISVGLCMV